MSFEDNSIEYPSDLDDDFDNYYQVAAFPDTVSTDIPHEQQIFLSCPNPTLSIATCPKPQSYHHTMAIPSQGNPLATMKPEMKDCDSDDESPNDELTTQTSPPSTQQPPSEEDIQQYVSYDPLKSDPSLRTPYENMVMDNEAVNPAWFQMDKDPQEVAWDTLPMAQEYIQSNPIQPGFLSEPEEMKAMNLDEKPCMGHAGPVLEVFGAGSPNEMWEPKAQAKKVKKVGSPLENERKADGRHPDIEEIYYQMMEQISLASCPTEWGSQYTPSPMVMSPDNARLYLDEVSLLQVADSNNEKFMSLENEEDLEIPSLKVQGRKGRKETEETEEKKKSRQSKFKNSYSQVVEFVIYLVKAWHAMKMNGHMEKIFREEEMKSEEVQIEEEMRIMREIEQFEANRDAHEYINSKISAGLLKKAYVKKQPDSLVKERNLLIKKLEYKKFKLLAYISDLINDSPNAFIPRARLSAYLDDFPKTRTMTCMKAHFSKNVKFGLLILRFAIELLAPEVQGAQEGGLNGSAIALKFWMTKSHMEEKTRNLFLQKETRGHIQKELKKIYFEMEMLAKDQEVVSVEDRGCFERFLEAYGRKLTPISSVEREEFREELVGGAVKCGKRVYKEKSEQEKKSRKESKGKAEKNTDGAPQKKKK